MQMRHAWMVAVCASGLLMAGCTDRQKMADLEQQNAALKAEADNLRTQVSLAAEDRTRIAMLEQSNQVLRAELAKRTTPARTTTATTTRSTTTARKPVATRKK